MVGVPCEPQPWGAQSCQGGCRLTMSSRPEPFRASKASASHGGRNREEQGREGDGPCARKPVMDGQVRDEMLEQEGSADPFLFCSFPHPPCFQMPSTKLSTASLRARPCACCFSQKCVCSKRELKRSKQ